MSAENPKPAASSKPPKHFLQFAQDYPEVMAAYQALGSAAHDAGPLDVKTRALIKLAIAAGARLEGAVHSHARRAVREGCTPEEIRHAILLATTTIGFPAMMAALSWVEDEIKS
jgi:alkylhydroperoxidase/carboxymuconolactone decarboxylase family protein YurZ